MFICFGEKTLEFVIAHHYRFDLTKQCLDSIPDINTVYLVDDTQVGDGRKYCYNRSFVKWIRPKNTPCILSEAVNLGAEQVKGEWFVWVNNDVMFNPAVFGWLDKIVESAKADLYLSQLMFSMALFKTSVFRKLGGLDPVFAPAGGEDEDYLMRLCQNGFKWSKLNFSVFHLEGGHHGKMTYSEQAQADKFEHKHGFRPHDKTYNQTVQQGFVPWT